MLENIKLFLQFKSVDKLIRNGNFDLALEKLNFLIKEEFRPCETFLKRGKLCHKLMMLEDAYSDFTYIITHCVDKKAAYYERMLLNYEISNYYEAILDANNVLLTTGDDFDIKRIKFLSMVFSEQVESARDYILEIFGFNKYKTIQFLFSETSKNIAENDLSKALRLLNIIDLIDKDNPIKILKEANIYGIANQPDKQNELLKSIDSIFPKYFISHFRFTDMYQERDLMEISFLLELKIFDKQGIFAYPMMILEGYKKQMEGHIIESKECFEKAVEINPNKPEGYVLLAQTQQLMSGYDNPNLRTDAEVNYEKAMHIYEQENLTAKVDEMKRQIRHLNSKILLK